MRKPILELNYLVHLIFRRTRETSGTIRLPIRPRIERASGADGQDIHAVHGPNRRRAILDLSHDVGFAVIVNERTSYAGASRGKPNTGSARAAALCLRPLSRDCDDRSTGRPSPAARPPRVRPH